MDKIIFYFNKEKQIDKSRQYFHNKQKRKLSMNF